MDWNDPYNLTVNNETFIYYRPTVAVPSVAWILVAIQLILVVLGVLVIIFRRDKQPLRARNPYFVLVSIFALTFVMLSMEVSQGIGYWRYPCFLVSLNNSFALGFIAFPVIMRLWKLLYVYKLNKLKTFVAGFTETDKKYLYQPLDEDSASFKDQQQKKIFKRWAFWISTPFTLIMLCVMFVFSLAFWLVGYVAVNSDRGAFFAFKQCIDGTLDRLQAGVRVLLVVVQAATYITLASILFLLLLINKVRDRFGIFWEALYSLLFWGMVFIIFVASGSIYIFNSSAMIHINRFWPISTRTVAIACVIDTFIIGVLPAFATFTSCYNKPAESRDDIKQKFLDNPQDTKLGDILRDPTAREQFKQFSTESFCTENVLFWEDIQQYKSVTQIKKLLSYADQIVEKYLVDNCPLELNIVNRDKTAKDIQSTIERIRTQENADSSLRFTTKSSFFNSATSLEASDFQSQDFQSQDFRSQEASTTDDKFDNVGVMLSLFDDVLFAVEVNMIDTVSRFTQTLAYQRLKSAESLSTEMMSRAGLQM